MKEKSILRQTVELQVSEPWDFEASVGTGKFIATIVEAQPGYLLLRLSSPIRFRGAELNTIVA